MGVVRGGNWKPSVTMGHRNNAMITIATSQGRVMSIEDRVKATAKNIEGKAQEALGDLTGDKLQKAEGQAKQAEASLDHAQEDLKDKAKGVLDELKKKLD